MVFKPGDTGCDRTWSVAFEVGRDSTQCVEKDEPPQRMSGPKVRLGMDLEQSGVPVRGDGFLFLFLF